MQADMQSTNYPVIIELKQSEVDCIHIALDLNREGDIKDLIEGGREFIT